MPDQPLTHVPEALFGLFPPTSREDWEAKIREDLREAEYARTMVWESLEGVEQRAFYRADDLAGVPHMEAVPLTRAEVTPANGWRIRQDLNAPSLDDAQRHAREAIRGGATDLGLCTAVREDELRGISIQHQDDLDTLLDEIDLATTPIHLAAGPASPSLYAMLCNTAEARGALDVLQGSIDYDPLAALSGSIHLEVERAFDLAASVVAFASARAPKMRTCTVDLRPYHEAGASAAQELGCALGALSEQIVQLRQRNGSLDVRSRLQFVVPLDTSYFVAIGKLRALRLLVPQVLAAFDLPTEPADVFIQAVTSRRSETLYDPHVNLLRGTTEAASAIIGGCDVLAVRPFTSAESAPNDFALRMARNTQCILRDEAHLGDVADPGAGAYHLEVLTDKLARAAWAFFQKLEDEGGLITALTAGTLHARIADVRRQREAQVAHGERVLVGTNRYPDYREHQRSAIEHAPEPVPLAESDAPPTLDDPASIDELRDAFAQGITLGDILRVMESSSQRAVDPLPRVRLAAPFERLRLRTERYAAAHGGLPRVVLLPLGDPATRSARADFARNAFGVAGFAIQDAVGFETPAEGARAVAEAEADVAVLCSTDDAYPALARDVREALAAAGADPLVVVIGNVPEHHAALEAAGVTLFIHRGAPLLETLTAIQHRLGINPETKNRRDKES